MSVEYTDDSLHRQLHHGFLGRENLRAELGRLLLRDSIDHCVVLTGGPGMGKSAIVTSFLAQCEAANELVVHHIVRRQQSDKAEPWVLARSLTVQIERRFPHLRDPFARPEACLSEILGRLSRELTLHGRRMVLVIDEIDKRSSGGDHREVLACLPRALPGGIRLLLSGGACDQLRDSRYGQVVAFDLDDPRFAADNEATVCAFWHREAQGLALDHGFVKCAVRRAAGNMLHATLLRMYLASVPRTQHRPEAIPRDLRALLAMMWQRVEADRPAVRALEILCAAREPLSLDQIGQVAGWSDPGDLRAVVNSARQLIFQSQRGDRVTVYGLFHEAVRSFLVEQLGPIAIRGHHRELADKLATWPAPRDLATRRYALRYAVGHRIATGDCQAIHALATNVDFLEAKCREFGIDDVELNVRRAAEACLAAGQFALHGELDRLARSIACESSTLPRDVGVDAAQLWCRVRQVRPSGHAPVPSLGGGDVQVGGRLGSLPGRPVLQPELNGRDRAVTPVAVASSAAGGAASVVVRSMSLPGRPGMLRDLFGGGGGGAVTACAVTADSRHAVAAYSDHSLKVWDIESGHLLRTITGHSGVVESCAVTHDGRVISASADTTLKVWNLETGDLLRTLEGHTSSVESCAVTPDGRIISASADTTLKVWDLNTGDLLHTLEGHTDSVESCAVTPDGRVISGSADTTLKVWDLDTGDLLATLKGHTDTVATCSVTADGRYVVSGSGDCALKIWDVDTGNVTTTLKGHAGPVASCVVASDRRSVYSASSDTTLKIWDVDTGRTVTTLEGHTGRVTCCAVTPNGRRLISGSSDDTLKVWALDGSHTSTLTGPGLLPAVTLRTPADRPNVQRARKLPGAKQLILFLAANPEGNNRDVLAEECAAIESELRQARHGTDFVFHTKWAVTVDEMARHLLDLDPTIVHFRGQGRRATSGSESTTSRDGSPHGDSGIYLCDERHEVQLVTGRALKMMVENSAPSARVVVLNACYSDGHAAELCQVVEVVVGMTRDHDHAARSFAVAFYRALGHRRSVGNAIAHSVATLAAKQIPDECIPRCRTLNWIDPHEISLSPDHLA